MANSFDIEKENDKFKATSHNFPECVGEGDSEQSAIDAMCKKIIYIRDNNPVRFKNVVKEQVKALLAKGDVPIFVYKGNNLL